jgi:hypothetical protein
MELVHSTTTPPTGSGTGTALKASEGKSVADHSSGWRRCARLMLCTDSRHVSRRSASRADHVGSASCSTTSVGSAYPAVYMMCPQACDGEHTCCHLVAPLWHNTSKHGGSAAGRGQAATALLTGS